MKIIHLKSIDSTHLYALRLIDSYVVRLKNDLDVLVIFADEQTSGVGKCNRQWVSKKGNLFTSIIMNLPKNSDLGQLSLAVACAIREAIVRVVNKHASGAEIVKKFLNKLKLHWPNDIYYETSKISGALLAVSNGMLVISVGINLNSSPNLPSCSTTNLRQVLQNLSVSEANAAFSKFHSHHQFQSDLSQQLHTLDILYILIESVASWVSHLCSFGFSEIRSYWLRNINGINCNVVVRNGDSILKGLFLGISDSGRAILQQSDRKLLISSGDLFVNHDKIQRRSNFELKRQSQKCGCFLDIFCSNSEGVNMDNENSFNDGLNKDVETIETSVRDIEDKVENEVESELKNAEEIVKDKAEGVLDFVKKVGFGFAKKIESECKPEDTDKDA